MGKLLKKIRNARKLRFFHFNYMKNSFKNFFKVYKYKGCRKLKSIFYSIKFNGLIIVYPKTKIILRKTANISISQNGCLRLNPCWHGKQNIPAYLYIGHCANLRVEGNASIYSGFDVVVEDFALLTLEEGYMNNFDTNPRG